MLSKFDFIVKFYWFLLLEAPTQWCPYARQKLTISFISFRRENLKIYYIEDFIYPTYRDTNGRCSFLLKHEPAAEKIATSILRAHRKQLCPWEQHCLGRRQCLEPASQICIASVLRESCCTSGIDTTSERIVTDGTLAVQESTGKKADCALHRYIQTKLVHTVTRGLRETVNRTRRREDYFIGNALPWPKVGVSMILLVDCRPSRNLQWSWSTTHKIFLLQKPHEDGAGLVHTEGRDLCGPTVGSSGKQWENLEACLDRCFVHKNRPESEIKMAWLAHIETERIAGIRLKPTMSVHDDACEKRGIFQGPKGGPWNPEPGMFDCGARSPINSLSGAPF